LCITAEGAIIFVCGDASKIEPDVKAALVAIYRESTRSRDVSDEIAVELDQACADRGKMARLSRTS